MKRIGIIAALVIAFGAGTQIGPPVAQAEFAATQYIRDIARELRLVRQELQKTNRTISQRAGR